MTAQDQFGVAVRAIGLLVMAYSLDKIMQLAQYALMYSEMIKQENAAVVGLLALAWIGLGWLLLVYADRVVAFSYKVRAGHLDSN